MWLRQKGRGVGEGGTLVTKYALPGHVDRVMDRGVW